MCGWKQLAQSSPERVVTNLLSVVPLDSFITGVGPFELLSLPPTPNLTHTTELLTEIAHVSLCPLIGDLSSPHSLPSPCSIQPVPSTAKWMLLNTSSMPLQALIAIKKVSFLHLRFTSFIIISLTSSHSCSIHHFFTHNSFHLNLSLYLNLHFTSLHFISTSPYHFISTTAACLMTSFQPDVTIPHLTACYAIQSPP